MTLVSVITVIGDAAGGDSRDDNDGTLDLPTLEHLFSETRAMRRMAVAEPGQEPQKHTDPDRMVHNRGLE